MYALYAYFTCANVIYCIFMTIVHEAGEGGYFIVPYAPVAGSGTKPSISQIYEGINDPSRRPCIKSSSGVVQAICHPFTLYPRFLRGFFKPILIPNFT